MPARLQIRDDPPTPSSDELIEAHRILVYAHESARTMLLDFDRLSRERGTGTTSDAQQNLLRAMLLFAGAGLDSCAKQTTRIALPLIVRGNAVAREELRKYAIRRLSRQPDADVSAGINAAFLVDLLIGEPMTNVMKSFSDDLTGGSLQSVGELMRIASALGAGDEARLSQTITSLTTGFEIRNRITHELDYNADARPRPRTQRRRNHMVDETNKLLQAADELLAAADRGIRVTAAGQIRA
jgi:hypothetical protein